MVDKFGYELELKLNEMLLEAELDVREVVMGVYALYDITTGIKLSRDFDNRVDAYIHAIQHLFEHGG